MAAADAAADAALPALPSSISTNLPDSDSDSDDHLHVHFLLPTTTTASPDPEPHLHHLHVPSLPSPITIRTLPSLGLSFQLWPSASTLLRVLPASPDLLPRSRSPLRVLELGSGTGAAGLALAASLPAYVLLTDLLAARPNLLHNASLNASLLASLGGSASIAALPWGNAAAMAAAVSSSPPFDAVVASDVVYYEALVDPLMATLRFFVKGEVVFLMAHMRRWKRTDKKFFGKARKVFNVEVVHEDPPLPGSRHGPVVYRFTAKKAAKK